MKIQFANLHKFTVASFLPNITNIKNPGGVIRKAWSFGFQMAKFSRSGNKFEFHSLIEFEIFRIAFLLNFSFHQYNCNIIFLGN